MLGLYNVLRLTSCFPSPPGVGLFTPVFLNPCSSGVDLQKENLPNPLAGLSSDLLPAARAAARFFSLVRLLDLC